MKHWRDDSMVTHHLLVLVYPDSRRGEGGTPPVWYGCGRAKVASVKMPCRLKIDTQHQQLKPLSLYSTAKPFALGSGVG